MNNCNEKFYWGSATSAHQVEGDNRNSDWWEWESIRPSSGQAGKIKNNDKSGKACEFWDRYRSDLKLAKELGHNAFRFSIEWAKVMRSPNQIINKTSKKETEMSLLKVKLRSNLEIDRHANARDDKINSEIDWKVIKHYQDVVDYCHKLGLEPFVTLWHFTNPKWFSDIGGWEKKENIKYFLEYVDLITKNIKGVKYWITINEPCVYTSGAYSKGVWPPGKKNIFSAIKVVNNMTFAHNEAYKIIRKNQPKSVIGFSKNNAYFEGGVLANIAKKYWNEYFLENTKFDFIGLNYYFHDRLSLSIAPPFVKRNNENKLVSDMNWEIYPEGIYHVLMELKKYKKPIIVTENGLADYEDKLRSHFIKDHIKYIHKAMEKDVDVRGYLYWSLLDNFEWAHGFKPRFGLIKIDYKTQKRTIRPSAKFYEKIIRNGKIKTS